MTGGSWVPLATTISNRELWVVHSIRVTNLLPSRHWDYLLCPDRVLGTYLSFIPLLSGEKPTLSCIFKGVPLTHSFLVVPTFLVQTLPSLLAGKGPPSQSESPYFFCSHNPLDSRLTGLSLPLFSPNYTIQHILSFTDFPGGFPYMGYPKPIYSQISVLSCHPIAKPYQLHHLSSPSPQNLRGLISDLLSKRLLWPIVFSF